MSYVKNTWNNGDVITKTKLDNMENGIELSANNLGRYQAEFGFDESVLSNTEVANNVLTLVAGQTTGTATKTISPSNIQNWGNLKWEQNIPANSSVMIDMLDASNNVLKAGVTSVADLSDIDISLHPSLKTRFTLSRDNVGIDSPSVSVPSWTWESKQKVDGWVKLDEIELNVSVSGLNIDFPENYETIKIVAKDIKTGESSGTLSMRFNDDSSSAYSWYYNAGNQNARATSSSSIDVLFFALDFSFAYFEIQISRNNNTSHKQVLMHGSTTGTGGGSYRNSDKITEINLIAGGSASINQGTIFEIWGLLE